MQKIRIISVITKKEWYEKNKKRILKMRKEYYEENKEDVFREKCRVESRQQRIQKRI